MATDRVTVSPFSWQDDTGLAIAGVCDVGCVRSENQDFMGYFERDGDVLVVVSDGMGGHQGGFEASRIAVAACGEVFEGASRKVSPQKLLGDAVKLANSRIRDRSRADRTLTGMGATVVMVLVRGGEYWFGHVGDSRAYLINSDGTEKMTSDHSRVQMLIDAGLLAPEKAKGHPLGHVLEYALGIDESVEIDVSEKPMQLNPGDTLMLCSDGVWGLVEESEYRGILNGSSLDKCAERIVARALEMGGNDNATAALLRFNGAADTEELAEVSTIDTTPIRSADEAPIVIGDDDDNDYDDSYENEKTELVRTPNRVEESAPPKLEEAHLTDLAVSIFFVFAAVAAAIFFL